MMNRKQLIVVGAGLVLLINNPIFAQNAITQAFPKYSGESVVGDKVDGRLLDIIKQEEWDKDRLKNFDEVVRLFSK